MLAPRKVKFEAQKKERENLEFRTFLKCNADKHEIFEDKLFESDDTFAFIAGYTSGGAPYGITWEEMEEIERREKHHSYNDKELDLPFD